MKKTLALIVLLIGIGKSFSQEYRLKHLNQEKQLIKESMFGDSPWGQMEDLRKEIIRINIEEKQGVPYKFQAVDFDYGSGYSYMTSGESEGTDNKNLLVKITSTEEYIGMTILNDILQIRYTVGGDDYNLYRVTDNFKILSDNDIILEDKNLISRFKQNLRDDDSEYNYKKSLQVLNEIVFKNTAYYRDFKLLSDEYLAKYEKEKSRDLEIANNEISLISDKISSNNNIIDDEIVKEFESKKLKMVYIPEVYYDYLENLKSENEKRKNNLKYEELVDITKSKFNYKEVATEIDSIYKELNEENKVKYGKFVDTNYLNTKKDTIKLNMLPTDYVKKYLQAFKDSGDLDNSIIIFEGEYNYGDHIAVDQGPKGSYKSGSGYISVSNYDTWRNENQTENIEVFKDGYKNLIEIGTGSFAYSNDNNKFYIEIKVANMSDEKDRFGNSRNNKSSLTSLKDKKLLPIILDINEAGLGDIFKTIDKKKILSQYSNDEDLVINGGNIENHVEIIPYREILTFYNSTVNQNNRRKPMITFEGWDLSIGKKLYIKDKNGNDIPIPDGKYKLEDLNRIETKSGVITKVKGISYGDIIILPESSRDKSLPPSIN